MLDNVMNDDTSSQEQVKRIEIKREKTKKANLLTHIAARA